MQLSDPAAFSADAPLVILGCGKMGGALLDGWLAEGLPGAAIRIVEPMPSDALTRTAADHGIALSTGFEGIGDTPKAVLIAIKPQRMADILPTLATRFGTAPLYVSIAAGTSIARFRALLGDEARIVRVMPNTPVAVGRGASAVYPGEGVTEVEAALAEALLAAVGETVRLDSESQMDAVTGVSGSGPAYVFHMIEALAAGGVAQGLTPDLAMRLARQTVVGAAALAEASEESAETLRVNVTSPNGTTAAALGLLMNEDVGLTILMTRAVAAAAERSRALSVD